MDPPNQLKDMNFLDKIAKFYGLQVNKSKSCFVTGRTAVSRNTIIKSIIGFQKKTYPWNIWDDHYIKVEQQNLCYILYLVNYMTKLVVGKKNNVIMCKDYFNKTCVRSNAIILDSTHPTTKKQY